MIREAIDKSTGGLNAANHHRRRTDLRRPLIALRIAAKKDSPLAATARRTIRPTNICQDNYITLSMTTYPSIPKKRLIIDGPTAISHTIQ